MSRTSPRRGPATTAAGLIAFRYELARCIGFTVIYVAGNLVTGDGTSTVHPCVNEPPGTAYFEVDNG